MAGIEVMEHFFFFLYKLSEWLIYPIGIASGQFTP